MLAIALAARLVPGKEAFNRGDFFEAHERWEDEWRLLTGDERDLVQGLIQIAAGLHHLGQGRGRPAATLMRKGAAKLPPGGDAQLASGLPLDRLAHDVATALAVLANGGVVDPRTFRL